MSSNKTHKILEEIEKELYTTNEAIDIEAVLVKIYYILKQLV